MYVCVCVHAYIRQYIDHHKHTCSNTFIHSCIIYTFTPYTHTHTHAGMIGKNLLAVQDMRYAHIHTICTHTHTHIYVHHTHTHIHMQVWLAKISLRPKICASWAVHWRCALGKIRPLLCGPDPCEYVCEYVYMCHRSSSLTMCTGKIRPLLCGPDSCVYVCVFVQVMCMYVYTCIGVCFITYTLGTSRGNLIVIHTLPYIHTCIHTYDTGKKSQSWYTRLRTYMHPNLHTCVHAYVCRYFSWYFSYAYVCRYFSYFHHSGTASTAESYHAYMHYTHTCMHIYAGKSSIS